MRTSLPRVLAIALGCLPISSLARGLEITFKGGVLYDDNVFLLDQEHKDIVDDGSRNNDKYDDMTSSSDVILDAGMRLEWTTRPLTDRNTRLRLEPGVSVYTANSRCTHFDLEASIDQRLWKKGSAYLEVGLVPSRFKKNYFLDGTDQNGNGVTGSEKDYAPGMITELDGALGVRSEVGKSLEVFAELNAGSEAWDAPLENHDESMVGAATGANVKLGKKITLGADLQFAQVTTPGESEVVITNRVRSVTPVDRSFTSTELSADLGFGVTDSVSLVADASIRQRAYTSDIVGDPYRERTDQRIGFGAGVRVETGAWRIGAGYDRLSNSTERPGDPDRSGDREQSYDKNVVSVTAQYIF